MCNCTCYFLLETLYFVISFFLRFCLIISTICMYTAHIHIHTTANKVNWKVRTDIFISIAIIIWGHMENEEKRETQTKRRQIKRIFSISNKFKHLIFQERFQNYCECATTRSITENWNKNKTKQWKFDLKSWKSGNDEIPRELQSKLFWTDWAQSTHSAIHTGCKSDFKRNGSV